MKNKYTLLSVNSKFIHSNLAIQYIKNFCYTKNIIINTLEFSINDNINKIISEIYLSNSKVIGFSCYIWNIEIILKICESLKEIQRGLIIVLGGPEVSYDNKAQLANYMSYIDYVVCGEGEKTFYELIKYIECKHTNINLIPGLIHKNNDKIIVNEKRKSIANLDIIPFPYTNISDYKNKIIYYETSRGCPFQCQYCLSSIEKGVRYFSLDRVFNDLDFFIEKKVKQVKLVDRTFNCDKKRCLKIMEYIINKGGVTNFHFEISAKLIDKEFISLVKNAAKGLFQFEIGIQSTNPLTLKSIKRNEPFEDIKNNIKDLILLKLFHVHLDLIAGLPYEDIKSFKNSFDDAYSLKPDMLQLGFLKLLKGSGLRENVDNYNIKHHKYPPYEVISTNSLRYDDIILLKNIENLLDTYYNSGKFKRSIEHIEDKYFSSPYDMYLSLLDYFKNKGYLGRRIKDKDLYLILYDFISETYGISLIFNELLKYDYFISMGPPLPEFLTRLVKKDIKTIINKFLRNEKCIDIHLPKFKTMSIRERHRHISFEMFRIDIMGDLSEKDIALINVKNYEPNKENKVISFEIKKLESLVGGIGVEPTTSCMSSRHSNQLS